MDALAAVKQYLTTILNKENGMSIVLLDDETTPIVSMTMTQSAFLSHEAYLVSKISDPDRQRLRHLGCICVLRPTNSSIQALVRELREPKYGSYSIYFTNIVPKSALEQLAEADDQEVVKTVQEYYADYAPIDGNLFSLNIALPGWHVYGQAMDTWEPHAFRRASEGLSAVLLALKKRPVIRYEANSRMAKRLAGEVQYNIENEPSLFDFRRTDTPPVLLVLDRKNDPVTPLLTQWTYEAMVHELIGIENGKVTLDPAAGVRPELSQVVLSSDQDSFYKSNMYCNFGDLGGSIKDFVSQFQAKTKNNENIQSITDMKRFVEEYPEFRKLKGNVSKHVTLVGELSRLVDAENLLEVSEVEQSLACSQNQAADLKAVQHLLQTPISKRSKLRLVCLYALRYETASESHIPLLIGLLKSAGVADAELVKSLLAYAGAKQRLANIFGGDFFSRARSGFKGLKGVENVYTQHQPYLETILSQLLKQRLPEKEYPMLNNEQVRREKPQDIIIFIVGGATYEEAKLCQEVQKTSPGVRIVLGGTSVLNSRMFLDQLNDAAQAWPERH